MRRLRYLGVGIAAGAIGALVWILARPAAVAPGVPEGPRVGGTRLFENVLSHVRSFGVDSMDDQALYRLAAGGIIDELDDPYAMLILPGQRVSTSDEATAPQGVFLDRQDGLVVVVATVPGSAGAAAGVRSGDRLVAIDSVPIDASRLDRAERLLAGAPGTRVTMRLRREGTRNAFPVELIRAPEQLGPAVETSVLRGGVARVVIRRFPAGVADSVRVGVAALRAAGARSLVLDLRQAVGGALADGVALADLFLDRGRKIASSLGRPAAASISYSDSTASPFDSIPVAVLVDAGTAGAAEVVAGALQDNDRAALLGAITFGRGVTQRVFELSGGASLRLTTALWMTPSGRQIQRPPRPADGDSVPRPKLKSEGGRTVLGGGGIVPDRLVTEDGPADLTLAEAQALLLKAGTTREILALVSEH